MNKIELNSQANSPIIIIEREFDASIDKVFEIFSKSELVSKWWDPYGDAIIHNLDFREGGKWSFSTGSDESAMTFHGFFHEISTPKRFVQTSEFDNLVQMTGDRGHTVLAKYEFEEVGENITKLTVTEVYMSVEDRDMAISNNMESGLVESYNKIDTLLKNSN